MKRLFALSSSSKVLWVAWAVCALALAAIALFPIRFTSLRATIFALWVLCWLFSGALAWRRKGLATAWSALSLLAIAFALWPRRVESAALRAAYASSLRKYEGALYVWGGETGRGIDCSGLIRRGFMDAQRSQGNWRGAFDLWWHDCSAKAMREEYRGQTRRIFDASSLNSIALSRLRPGDVAVTQSGVHTLAYLGAGEWIEADPGAWKTIRVRTPSPNPWFQMPISIVRWRELDD